MNEIKKCPFCNGKANIIGFSRKKNIFGKSKYVKENEKADAYFIKCNICSCQTSLQIIKEDAIEKWNTRNGE